MQKNDDNSKSIEAYWSKKYQTNATGWDIGYASTPIKEFIDQLENKDLKILIPGAGNAHEAEYLFRQGFANVFVLDITQEPLVRFANRVPDFPKDQLLHENFFEHHGEYDLILEQTFFCSFPPSKTNRQAYAKKMHELLVVGGKLVGLWFTFPLDRFQGNPPFGGSIVEYESYFKPYFSIKTFEMAYNSIKPRQGNEAFGILQKR